MTVALEEPVAGPVERRPPSRGLELAVRLAGMLVTIIATVATAILELSLTTLRLGGVPVGVAIPLAIVANVGLSWFAVTTVGRRWALGPPWVLWTLLMLFVAGARRTEGDYLLSGTDWVSLVMILVGSLTFAVYAYRMILKGPTITKQ